MLRLLRALKPKTFVSTSLPESWGRFQTIQTNFPSLKSRATETVQLVDINAAISGFLSHSLDGTARTRSFSSNFGVLLHISVDLWICKCL